MENRIKIAIQKNGRLHEGSMQILKECGMDFSNGYNKLRSEVRNFPMDILFLRDDDIPEYVENGISDLGIAGENVILEKKRNVTILEKLGFGKCRLSISLPTAEQKNYKSPEDLNGKRIATSHCNILMDYLKVKKIKADIHEIKGSVEISTGIGLADAICDLVSTGSTLFINGLREAEVILESEAALISNKNINEQCTKIVNNLLFRIQAVKRARNNKYILLNIRNDKIKNVLKIIPGIKSPTVLPLAKKGWSSIHTVINENDFWGIIENLKSAGAEGILVVPIEKMII